jgi:hypothetical protein
VRNQDERRRRGKKRMISQPGTEEGIDEELEGKRIAGEIDEGGVLQREIGKCTISSAAD